MTSIVYRCPATGLNVQGWLADDLSVNDGKVYETMACPACTWVHLVNRARPRMPRYALGVNLVERGLRSVF